MLLDTESGKHVYEASCKYVKVRAMRYEPLDNRGIVDIDGEVRVSISDQHHVLCISLASQQSWFSYNRVSSPYICGHVHRACATWPSDD